MQLSGRALGPVGQGPWPRPPGGSSAGAGAGAGGGPGPVVGPAHLREDQLAQQDAWARPWRPVARAPAVQFRRRHSFGGSPFGPAGKARPVPLEAALGDQLDRHGLVLNCDKVLGKEVLGKQIDVKQLDVNNLVTCSTWSSCCWPRPPCA